MTEDAQALQTMYPDLIRAKSIGESVEGRRLLLLELGKGKRRIFLNGAVHAREYISTTYLMYMIDRYAYAYATEGVWNGYDLEKILDQVTFCVVPMVNPDGVNLVQNGFASVKDPEAVMKITTDPRDPSGFASWKANVRGVDLNRNYPARWTAGTKIPSPSYSLFKGQTPLSEPETKAIDNYLNSAMCWAFISFHSMGEGVYGWDDARGMYYPQLYSMVSRIMKASGFVKLTDTEDTSYGTFAGYVRKTFLKPALTIELCKYTDAQYSYPDEDFDRVWRPAQDICLIVAEEVMKMEAQPYWVYQNETFLHAFSNKDYAIAYAKRWANSKVLYVRQNENPGHSTVLPGTSVVYGGNS
jgi:g-D-glutamyl-meso-diaminopimelate peptidase